MFKSYPDPRDPGFRINMEIPPEHPDPDQMEMDRIDRMWDEAEVESVTFDELLDYFEMDGV